MKKLVLPILFVSFALSTNAQTVKKVILEDFTGTWCGWCPEGTVVLDGMEAANPTSLIPVASHNNDGLKITDGSAIQSGLSINSFPAGAVDRFKFPDQSKVSLSRNLWNSKFAARLATPAIASISFSNLVKTTTGYTAKVNVKFTSAPTAGTPVKLNVYILEDSISATGSLAQSNYSSSVQGGASPLTNWFHNNTLRSALGGAWGYSDFLNTVTVGTTYTKDITIELGTGWVAKHIKIVAFVAYDGATGATTEGKEIINAESVALKYFYPLAIDNVNLNMTEAKIYPNPAKADDILKLTFNLKKDSKVHLDILNILGQTVSQPYSSDEIQGTHTIQMSSKMIQNFVPGVYFARLTTDNGSVQTLKFIIK